MLVIEYTLKKKVSYVKEIGDFKFVLQILRLKKEKSIDKNSKNRIISLLPRYECGRKLKRKPVP
jgi:hypothetical protein